MRVGLKIVKLPFVDVGLVKADELVAAVGDAVMAAHIVPAGEFIVVIIEGGAPILRRVALEDGNEAAALDIAGHPGTGSLKEC